MEDDFIYLGKLKTTLIQGKWNIKNFKNERQPQKCQDKQKSFLNFSKIKGQSFPGVGSAL